MTEIRDAERMLWWKVVYACGTCVMLSRSKAGILSDISEDNIRMTRKREKADLSCAAEWVSAECWGRKSLQQNQPTGLCCIWQQSPVTMQYQREGNDRGKKLQGKEGLHTEWVEKKCPHVFKEVKRSSDQRTQVCTSLNQFDHIPIPVALKTWRLHYTALNPALQQDATPFDTTSHHKAPFCHLPLAEHFCRWMQIQGIW
jgi:hypothetical protein